MSESPRKIQKTMVDRRSFTSPTQSASEYARNSRGKDVGKPSTLHAHIEEYTELQRAIEVLVNSGRQLEAVNLVFAFELTEQLAPVPLLKAYLKEARRASQVKPGNTSPGAQNEANDRELSALKAVVKCIEEHKLEEQYPIDPLQKRILQLEKAKADKKRVAEAAKPQPKRPRANGGSYAPRVITNITEKSFYRSPERYPYMYDRPYMYAPENHGSPLLPPAAPYSLSPGHGSYYGNGYQYATPYMH